MTDKRTAEFEALTDLVSRAISIFSNCSVETGSCCCGDNMENHAHPMSSGHSPVDEGAYQASNWLDKARATLAKQPGEPS